MRLQGTSSGAFKPLDLAGTDGTQIAAAVLRDNVDTRQGDKQAVALMRRAEVSRA